MIINHIWSCIYSWYVTVNCVVHQASTVTLANHHSKWMNEQLSNQAHSSSTCCITSLVAAAAAAAAATAVVIDGFLPAPAVYLDGQPYGQTVTIQH
jgi:hypothetical protein